MADLHSSPPPVTGGFGGPPAGTGTTKSTSEAATVVSIVDGTDGAAQALRGLLNLYWNKEHGKDFPFHEKLSVEAAYNDIFNLADESKSFRQTLGIFLDQFSGTVHSSTYQYGAKAVADSFKGYMDAVVASNKDKGGKHYDSLSSYLNFLNPNVISVGGKGGSVTPTQWATWVLNDIGAPTTQNNLDKILHWIPAEGPWGSQANPLNVSGNNGPIKYGNLREAAKATAQTLENGYYPAVLANFIHDGGLGQWSNALVNSPWAGGHYGATKNAQGVYVGGDLLSTALATGSTSGGGVGTPLQQIQALSDPTNAKAKAPKHNIRLYTDQWGNTAIQSPTASEEYSSYERVLTALHAWGLDDPPLVAMAHSRVIAGEDYNQIINDIRKTPQYNAQFPGIALRQKDGLPLISETQYLTYERDMMGLSTKYALPHGFIDKHEIGELIAHNVSPTEFNARLQGLATLVTQANPLVKKEFEKYFGVRGTNGALAAYWANPNKATMLLQQQLHAAEYGAQVRETGLGSLNKGQAINLAHYEYLHSPGTVANAITDASHYANLEGAAPGSSTSSVGVQQLLGARLSGYNGNQAENAARVRNAESAKEGTLLAGGGYSANPTGITGAGSAATEGVGRA